MLSLITNIYYKKTTWNTNIAPQLEEFQQWFNFPTRWRTHVRQFLDATFPNRWIWRDSPKAWPPRSPDIIPLDFFL